MELTYSEFLAVWQIIMMGLTVLSAIAGIIIFIVHKLKITSLSDYKQKYDYIAGNETKMILYVIIAFSIAITAFINLVYPDIVILSVIWLFVRMFIALCVGTLIVYISNLILKYAYPNTLEKKMKHWRYKARVNKKTGNTMKLLSEEEEDVHLDQGMQAEENVFSVDYDVWVDEATGDVQIEKYPGHLIAYQCNSCGFKTMKLIKEEIITAPTQESSGEMIKYYRCSYCKAKRNNNMKVAKLSQSESSYELPAHFHFKDEEKVEQVQLEIFISNGKAKVYTFGSTKQAADFLKEFKIED